MSVMRDRILAKYSDRYLRKSAIRHEDAEIFRKLLEGKGYKTILEIGTYRGCTSAELSQYCERVITIDLVHGRIDVDEKSIDRHEFWESIGAKNINLALVTDDQMKADFVDGLEFDFAFIDGAHDYESVKFDFEIVKKCGRVLFHDVYENDPKNADDVSRFVNSIDFGKIERFGIFALWTA